MMETLTIVGLLRYAVLIACLSGAAWLDYKSRRVPNEYWISWAKPAIFLWFVELLILGANFTILLSAIAIIAYASQSVFGRPSLSDLTKGVFADWFAVIFYVLGIIGLGNGAYLYGEALIQEFGLSESSISLSTDNALVEMWGSILIVGLMIAVFDFAWRLRLIHGGADAKALMLIAILLPNWSTLSETHGIDFTPPALSLLLWGGLTFALLPLLLTYKNIKKDGLKSISNFKMIWHAEKMMLNKIGTSHVWILDSIVEGPEGEVAIKTNSRPPKKSRSKNEQELLVNELKDLGRDWAWVTQKYPLLTFLLPAIIPLIILGDPVYWIMTLFGLV